MKYRIYWDNGASACGSFPTLYDTRVEAEDAAAAICTENIAQDVWAEGGYCEVFACDADGNEIDDDEEA